MRLIDADATVIGLDTALACSRVVAGKDALQNKALDIFENARDFVANMPTIDAVPVVRCRDCQYWQDNNGGYPNDECRWGKGETPDADDFCSYGVRKENNND